MVITATIAIAVAIAVAIAIAGAIALAIAEAIALAVALAIAVAMEAREATGWVTQATGGYPTTNPGNRWVTQQIVIHKCPFSTLQ